MEKLKFDPRPRKPNGTLLTKLTREGYIKQLGFTVQSYNELLKKNNPEN